MMTTQARATLLRDWVGRRVYYQPVYGDGRIAFTGELISIEVRVAIIKFDPRPGVPDTITTIATNLEGISLLEDAA
jgi:hypothetical protein